MKILFYGDCHLRDVGSFPPFNLQDSNGLTKELNNMISGVKFVADKILELNPDVVINLGDFYNSTETISCTVLHGSSIALGYVKNSCDEIGCKHLYVPGQHEVINEALGITSVSNLIGYFDHIASIKEPFTSYNVDGYKIALIPHITDVGKASQLVKRGELECDLIATHMNFHGAMYENGAKSDSQLSPKLSIDCISGDIHFPSKIHNVYYPGSITQHKFYKDNIENIGGILLYDTETKAIERFKNFYSKHYVRVSNIDEALKLDPDTVVLQIKTTIDKEEIDEIFPNYDYWYVPDVHTNEVEAVYENEFVMEDPHEVLRSYIEREQPLAIDDFDEIFGSKDEKED